MDLIWYPQYIDDYSRATSGLSLLEHGAYRVLLDEYYRTRQPLDANAERLHRICRAISPEEKAAVDYVIGRYFELRAGQWHHQRADAEIEKAASISGKRSSAARKRHSNGGNAHDVGSANAHANARQVHDQKQTQPQPQPQPQPQEDNRQSEAPASNAMYAEGVRLVFEHWQTVHGHPAARLGKSDSKRYKAIAGRLKDGYTVEQLCRAVNGCKNSSHHMGRDPKSNPSGTIFDDIELICRDAAHVDKFVRLAAATNLGALSAAGRATAMAAQEWLEETSAGQ